MAQVLRPFTSHRATSHPDLLVGLGTSDDGGVFRVDRDRALVQTVDFFAPIVDEPYDWGRIAAANALSDVYAMGGRPVTALQLVGWPRAKLPLELLADVMAGGADVMVEARTTIAGGHSIDAESPLYGFSVTGLVDPAVMTTNAAARPGDLIVLTKPLGTGVITTGLKAQVVGRGLRNEAVSVMATLNGAAARLMVEAGVRCATDVTGYGLLGHLREIMNASNVSARVDASAVPVLEGVVELVEAGVYPGGSSRNLRSVAPIIESHVGDEYLRILADAQTGGGLLMAVAPRILEGLIERLVSVAPAVAVIGEFVAAEPKPRIEVS